MIQASGCDLKTCPVNEHKRCYIISKEETTTTCKCLNGLYQTSDNVCVGVLRYDFAFKMQIDPNNFDPISSQTKLLRMVCIIIIFVLFLFIYIYSWSLVYFSFPFYLYFILFSLIIFQPITYYCLLQQRRRRPNSTWPTKWCCLERAAIKVFLLHIIKLFCGKQMPTMFPICRQLLIQFK